MVIDADLRRLSCDEGSVPPGEAWLTERERARLLGMRFTKRRNEYLLRRAAGKRAVAAHLGLGRDEAALGRVAMLNRPGGAPYAEVDGEPAALDVSLTDRAGCAVALVGGRGSMAAGTLGVDLEIVEPRSPGFVADFLTPAEATWVSARRDAAGADGWDAAANLVWSAKEAALKVLRVGLRADTRSVEVDVDEAVGPSGWAALAVAVVGSGTVLPGWWRRDGAFVLTVAAREPFAPPSELPGSVDLSGVAPSHAWMARPLVD